MSILYAVNTVNLVNTVNAVKRPPPPGGIAQPGEHRPPTAVAWGLDRIDGIDGGPC
ncbi:MAG: hypothetical protein ACK6DQ_19470 [Planctomycetota bacterium]